MTSADVLPLDVVGIDSRELECVAADMETRLRGTVLRILRPALDRIKDVDAQLRSLSHTINQYEPVFKLTQGMKSDLQQQQEFSNVLSDQLEKMDRAHRELERESSVNIAELRINIKEASTMIDQNSKQITVHGKELERIWDETKRQQKQHEETIKDVWDGIERCNRKNERVKEDLAEVVKQAARNREDLLDSLFGDGKGLTKLARDLAALTAFCQPIPEMQKHMDGIEVRQKQLDKQSADVLVALREFEGIFNEFRVDVKAHMKQLREDFRTEANRLTGHHAALMKDLRKEYQEEILMVRELRADVQEFQGVTERLCSETTEKVTNEGRRLDALQCEVLNDLEEMQRKRKKDRLGWETEIREVRQDMTRSSQGISHVHANSEFLSKIVGLVLEGQRMSSAMFLQDYIDRRAEKWLSPPSEKSRRPEEACSAEVLEEVPRREYNKVSHEIRSVDWRAGLVSAEYLPGMVLYGGSYWDRQELILLCHKLLQKAHQVYVRGPESLEGEPGRSQPGANGSASSGQRPVSRPLKASMAEAATWPKSSDLAMAEKLSPGQKQRPGSQGQPQANGSGGRPLGKLPLAVSPPIPELLPHSGQATQSSRALAGASVRLPSIEGAGGGFTTDATPRKASLTAR